MKSILISIKPEYVEKILNGEKTIEIRKTKPKCELPCKVYIYCTKQKRKNEFITKSEKFGWIMGRETTFYNRAKEYDANGKVVAEFILNKVDILERDLNDWLPKNRYDVSNDLLKNINLNQNELWNYGQGKTLYAWYIDDLKIYDKPKELSEFGVGKAKIDCGYGNYNTYNKILKRPPQSYCYVEELENE